MDPAARLFLVVRFAGIASAAMVMPVALAMAATSYTGIPRATAIGIAYAAYGLGQGLSPTLVALVPGTYAPAFVGSIVACALALVVVRGRDPRPPEADARPSGRTCTGPRCGPAGWCSSPPGSCGLASGLDNPLRIALILGGIALVAAFILWERRRRAEHAASRAHRTAPGDHRAVRGPGHRHRADRARCRSCRSTSASGCGTARSSGCSPSRRCSPPWSSPARSPASCSRGSGPGILIAGGILVIGVGDLLVAAAIGPTTTYLAFIVPLILIGGGFVVATTVRTAIIFASVPRGLPATAAALNEASIEVGTRAGIVVVTGILAEVAIAVYTASVAGQPQAQVDGLVATFRDVLVALGTPSFECPGRAAGRHRSVQGGVLRRGPGRAARGRGGRRGRLGHRLAHARTAGRAPDGVRASRRASGRDPAGWLTLAGPQAQRRRARGEPASSRVSLPSMATQATAAFGHRP